MNKCIGFMQGRLSPLVNGKIQAFPWEHWQSEFSEASALEISKMEWTLDHEDLYKNPLMTAHGQEKIRDLIKNFNLTIPSLTGDCFMQKPFFRLASEKNQLLHDYENIVEACSKIRIKYIIFPLVDQSSINNKEDEFCLVSELVKRTQLLEKNGVKIAFESDFPPDQLKTFINQFPREHFGINYDSGNSAALGFSPKEEFSAYGDRILNIHIKDRVLHGTTVPLGEGNADFDIIFDEIKKIKYQGNLILQTARSKTEEHAKVLLGYAKFVDKMMA
jgi:L-ribulose-5-phosphate 3-epimerase